MRRNVRTCGVFLFLCAAAAWAPDAAAKGAAQQPGDSPAAADDDTEPGGQASAATVVVAPPTGTDTTVVTAVTIHEPTETGRIEGRHRLHIDTDVFAWRRTMPWRDEMDMDGDGAQDGAVDSINLIGGVPVLGAAGLGPTGNFGIGYAYGVTERIIVGARLGLGFQHLSTPEPDRAATGLFGYWLTPYFEFVGRPGQRIRPFFGLRLGFGGSIAANKTGDTTARTSTIGPLLGLGLGLHAFVTERVSLDPSINLDYALIWSRGTVKTEPPMGMNMMADTSFQRNAMAPNVSVMLGLSVWLGRDDHSDRDRRRMRSSW